ncbi:MAG TPA: metalloregulator ArsR/SmtB family transcription factor [Candidatus Binataceae bacterium]|jgi:DNA-binding transcriptional ArsR family regulator|nr:metalloregulator ArsR/SmtB family transcription factor [Candidatus Binataceae bacterium]
MELLPTKAAAIAALGALAQETRLDIFRLLIGIAPHGMAAGEIGRRLSLAAPTLSFHLNQLRFARLVTSRRQGRSIIYFADYEAMNGLLGYLTDHCCGGRPGLCQPEPCAAAVNQAAGRVVKRAAARNTPQGRARRTRNDG